MSNLAHKFASTGSMSGEEHTRLLKEAVLNDPYAYEFLARVTDAFRVWDNAWDQDHPTTKEDFDRAFSTLAFDLSRNPFFKTYRDILEAQIFVAWNAWSDANLWESSKEEAKRACAWFIRNYCNELVPLCAWLLGGKDHARKISTKLREGYLGDWPNF